MAVTTKIRCEICNSEISLNAFSRHLVKHKVFFIDYVKLHNHQFPNYKKCLFCDNLTTGTTCSRICHGKYVSSYMKGKFTGEKNPGCSIESRTKQSNTKKRKILAGTYTGHVYKSNHIPSNATKKKISESAKLRLSDPTKNPMYGKTHTVEAVQKIFSNRNITAPEIKIRDFLSDNNIDYTYQYFIIENGICKSYDFKINNVPLIIEVDGDYWHGGPGVETYFFNVNETKQNDLLKDELAKTRNIKVLRIWESEIKKDFESVKHKIITEIALLSK